MSPPSATARDEVTTEATIARQWRELKRIGWLFGLLLLSSFVLGTAAKVHPSPWPGVIMAGLDAALVLGFVISRCSEVAPLLTRPHIGTREAVRLLLGSLAFAIVLKGYFAVLTHLGAPMIDFARPYEDAQWPVWSMFVLGSVMPATFEELAFRGVIQSALERVGSGREAWIIQAALFSVLHLSPLIFPSHFVMGLWFGWLRRRTCSVYPGMLMHGGWNAMLLYLSVWAGD